MLRIVFSLLFYLTIFSIKHLNPYAFFMLTSSIGLFLIDELGCILRLYPWAGPCIFLYFLMKFLFALDGKKEKQVSKAWTHVPCKQFNTLQLMHSDFIIKMQIKSEGQCSGICSSKEPLKVFLFESGQGNVACFRGATIKLKNCQVKGNAMVEERLTQASLHFQVMMAFQCLQLH